MSLEEETKFLAYFITQIKEPGAFSIALLRAELERYIGRSVATSTAYQLLHRHGLSLSRNSIYGRSRSISTRL